MMIKRIIGPDGKVKQIITWQDNDNVRADFSEAKITVDYVPSADCDHCDCKDDGFGCCFCDD